MLFLGVDPYIVQKWWQQVLLESYYHGKYDPLHNVMSEVMWRNCKKDVINQIELPPQTEQVSTYIYSDLLLII